jgi:membrane complex biogenesis BtpA family protein
MRSITGREKSLIAMVHVQALPGTPRASKPMEQVIDIAVAEAELLAGAGVDSIILENMHDAPYLKRCVGPEIVAGMAAVASAVRRAVPAVPLGIQVLAGANKEALAVALAAGLQFIRAEGFVFAHVADEGLIESDAGELLRYRRAIGAEHVKVLADIKKKHSAHAITADVSLGDTAEAAQFFGVDGLIVTGTATGKPVRLEDLDEVRRECSLPLLVGSGTTPENIASLLARADAVIVGSWFKRDGDWRMGPDEVRVKRLVESFRRGCP